MKLIRLLSISLIIAPALFGSCTEKLPDVPPNIVWITSEDNSVHYMDLFDPNGAPTPNIAALAERGVVFDRAFSNSPVCSAARSTLIAGCYGPRVASHYHRKLQTVPMPEGVEMYPAYLRKAGYYTTNNSKEDYNLVKADDVWDESSKDAHWRNREEGQPFFHIQNFTTTHESRLHFTEEEMKTEATVTDPGSVLVLPNHPQTDLFRYTNARYRDRIMEMDGQAGEVIAQLKEEGLMENTFIFYYGDHGGVLPGSKGYLAEVGLHVPLVVYIPPKYENLVDVSPGTRTGGFVSFVDFGATLLNLAGVEIPEGIDGRPFLGPDISKEDLESRDETFSYADRFDEKYDMARALRKGDLKYVRNYQPFNFDGLMNNYRYKQLAYQEWKSLFDREELNKVQSHFFVTKPAEALYDLSEDPYETKNLAEDPAYAEKLADMRERLRTRVKGLPDLSFYPEFHLVNDAFDNPVDFGLEHKSDIGEYVDVADLALLDFGKAKPGIEKALSSEDPWKRYWGLIACSTFGKESSDLADMATELSMNDPERINRVRAAEFLALAGIKNPAGVMLHELYGSTDPAEANLILNCIVLMRDSKHAYTIDVEPEHINPDVRSDMNVDRRLGYLTGN